MSVRISAFIIAFIVLNVSVIAQTTFSQRFGAAGGMGITIVNATDVVDYINSVSGSTRQDDFTAAPEFFGSVAVRLSQDWGVKVEYAYLIKTYTVPIVGWGDFDYAYGIHMPTVLAQYLHTGEGYAFKFGGGAGYHVVSFTEEFRGAIKKNLRSSGVGIKLEAEANTTLGGDLYAYLAGDFRTTLMSKLKDSGGATLPISSAGNKDARMNFFTLGLKLGLIYYF